MRFFLWFSRGVIIKTLRLSYRVSNLVLWEPQKFSIIQKNNSSNFFFQNFTSVVEIRISGYSLLIARTPDGVAKSVSKMIFSNFTLCSKRTFRNFLNKTLNFRKLLNFLNQFSIKFLSKLFIYKILFCLIKTKFLIP